MVRHDDQGESQAEFDTINLVFGSAFSAYVGVVLANDKLKYGDYFSLVLILLGVVMVILSTRAIYRSLVGVSYVGFRWPWNLSFALLWAASVQVLALSLPSMGEQFSFILRGWLLAYATVLGSSILRERRKRD